MCRKPSQEPRRREFDESVPLSNLDTPEALKELLSIVEKRHGTTPAEDEVAAARELRAFVRKNTDYKQHVVNFRLLCNKLNELGLENFPG